MSDKPEKNEKIQKTKGFVQTVILTVFVLGVLMLVGKRVLIYEGIPGPQLYFQKEAVIKRIGRDKFARMAKLVAPTGLAVVCAGGVEPSQDVIDVVNAYNDKYGKKVQAFVKGLELTKEEQFTMDQYFFLYFKRQVMSGAVDCGMLKNDITKGKYNP
ncbi:MAG: hypothetical protein GC185_03495 [Alphaproteobacteria bacterium]|nr:hypothetical protein [Alphaproteobacteria bacterium]